MLIAANSLSMQSNAFTLSIITQSQGDEIYVQRECKVRGVRINRMQLGHAVPEQSTRRSDPAKHAIIIKPHAHHKPTTY